MDDKEDLMQSLDLSSEPMSSFENWWSAVTGTNELDPEAFCLSTSSGQGWPRSRIVLLRGRDSEGFYFFTNYQSDKAREITANPHVSLTFHWRLPVHRQVRIEGLAEKASAEISDDYFKTRPRGSKISAWTSPQSKAISSRQELEDSRVKFEERFKEKDVPRPEFWGGFLIRPERLEFWQEEKHRFHHRVLYTRDPERPGWRSQVLAP